MHPKFIFLTLAIVFIWFLSGYVLYLVHDSEITSQQRSNFQNLIDQNNIKNDELFDKLERELDTVRIELTDELNNLKSNVNDIKVIMKNNTDISNHEE